MQCPKVVCLLAAISLLGTGAVRPTEVSATAAPTTWSVVAVDPATGDVGVAAASCVDIHMDMIAALAPGLGAVAVQADFTIENRNRAFELLKKGTGAAALIKEVTTSDAQAAVRQYGVVTIKAGAAEVAAYTGTENEPWSGDAGSTGAFAVTVQGNVLENSKVVSDALAAFNATDVGKLALSDRLMRAVEAGSAAGGDKRCNTGVKQTAAAAFIMMARGGDAPFATADEGTSVIQQTERPFLALSVSKPISGPNPLVELRSQYDAWRAQHLPPCTGCQLQAIAVPPGAGPASPGTSAPGATPASPGTSAPGTSAPGAGPAASESVTPAPGTAVSPAPGAATSPEASATSTSSVLLWFGIGGVLVVLVLAGWLLIRRRRS